MKDLKGTKTFENLLTAFAGESEARNKYTFYAEKPRKMVTSKLRTSSWKLRQMKRNTRSFGLSLLTASNNGRKPA